MQQALHEQSWGLLDVEASFPWLWLCMCYALGRLCLVMMHTLFAERPSAAALKYEEGFLVKTILATHL